MWLAPNGWTLLTLQEGRADPQGIQSPAATALALSVLDSRVIQLLSRGQGSCKGEEVPEGGNRKEGGPGRVGSESPRKCWAREWDGGGGSCRHFQGRI